MINPATTQAPACATEHTRPPDAAALAQLQTALVQTITSLENNLNTIKLIANYPISTSEKRQKTHPIITERGLNAYRANARAHAQTALWAAYPVLYQMLGADTFNRLARDLWQASPPMRGDLALWGMALGSMLREAPACAALVAEHPYLPDVADIEWALHTSCAAADGALDAASFGLMTSHAPEQLVLRLAPGAQVLTSDYPCAAIVQAHQGTNQQSDQAPTQAQSNSHGSACPAVDLSAATALLVQGVGQTTLLWRHGFTPRLCAVDPALAALVQATLNGAPLSSALDAALQAQADFDFSAWLARSVEDGLLLGVDAVF